MTGGSLYYSYSPFQTKHLAQCIINRIGQKIAALKVKLQSKTKFLEKTTNSGNLPYGWFKSSIVLYCHEHMTGVFNVCLLVSGPSLKMMIQRRRLHLLLTPPGPSQTHHFSLHQVKPSTHQPKPSIAYCVIWQCGLESPFWGLCVYVCVGGGVSGVHRSSVHDTWHWDKEVVSGAHEDS